MASDFTPKTKKYFDPNLYSERRFEEIFTKGEALKRHDDRNVDKLDAYGRLLHHMISNIVIPNIGHKSSITNMHFFAMLALHEHRRMNFRYMVIEHMLSTQTSSTKFLPYGCFFTKVFQYFVLKLVGVGDPIRAGKIYNKHTFKRMGFEKNEEGMLVRGGQDESDESDEDDEDNEGQEAMNVDEEESEEELEEETYRSEMRQKKSIVEKGPFVPQMNGRVKKVEEFDEFDSRKMILNFQAMNILSCVLDVNEYNKLNGCDSTHEM
ncbi:hypothetical protein M9H77_26279 [Catharanthus roseus]|uniref:Uncharacterized protein n=1 Tax=Catharanthus roseus TaxID=4058 RepID=A0ACC0AA74_CATRO|nr:hypothetical protein M9H77_26279 [Catharanthus roseus]